MLHTNNCNYNHNFKKEKKKGKNIITDTEKFSIMSCLFLYFFPPIFFLNWPIYTHQQEVMSSQVPMTSYRCYDWQGRGTEWTIHPTSQLYSFGRLRHGQDLKKVRKEKLVRKLLFPSAIMQAITLDRKLTCLVDIPQHKYNYK